MPLIECVPNLSEGRRSEVVDAIVDAIRVVPGVRVLDVSSDASHNRSVITLVGEPTAMKTAVISLFERALESIDVRVHSGEHPRLGAVDVVPFIPIADVTMGDCVALARETAAAVAARFDLPVFLYEQAATRETRRNLADIRRGEFEGLSAKLADPAWQPDFGPATPHPSAGATVIGARMPLIAFNVNLDTDRLDTAKQIAAAVRSSSGGLPAVKALGVSLSERGIVQVSMNLTNYQQTSIMTAFAAVKAEARRRGVEPLESQIVGLVPASAITWASPAELLLTTFSEEQVLEKRLAKVEEVE
jgi:glutamate formiminotransferase / 5-formyltetrahydrofolate cyclo-ligase